MTKIEMELAMQEEKCLATIRELRDRNFKKNIPFQLLNETLPKGQAYYLFPDGHIEIQQVFAQDGKFHTQTIRILSNEEADTIRAEYGLQ